MSKDIKDYLHLYLGCDIDNNVQGQYVHPYGCVKIDELTPENYATVMGVMNNEERNFKKFGDDKIHYCKPILRPLSDMTEEEFLEFKVLADEDFDKMIRIPSVAIKTRISHKFEATRFLLSKGFDLFNLIPEGLAIDKTKIKNQ